MDIEEGFKKVNVLTGKYPNLNKEEVKELRDLMRNLSVGCTDMLRKLG